MLMIFIVLIVCFLLEEKLNLNHIRKYVKINIFVASLSLLKNLVNTENLINLIIYEDLEWLIEKTNRYENNPKISSAKKVG